MRAAIVRIVEDEGVAGFEAALGGDLRDHGTHREGHGADEDRQALRALHERVAGLRMVQAVAGVARLGDDGVEGAAIERRVHLVGDLLEPALQHGQRHGVDRHSYNPR